MAEARRDGGADQAVAKVQGLALHVDEHDIGQEIEDFRGLDVAARRHAATPAFAVPIVQALLDQVGHPAGHSIGHDSTLYSCFYDAIGSQEDFSMGISWLDHVNIRTTNLAAMSRFYADILGMPSGPRPNFRFGGAWHTAATAPLCIWSKCRGTHDDDTPRLEHFAFRSFGFAPFLDRLRKAGIAYDIAVVPGLNIRQVNIYDPDGNHIEAQFGPDEQADMAAFEGRAS
jgi:catechol 2,3-dioxygenase-like lactoylglutathione lyase family enzyme